MEVAHLQLLIWGVEPAPNLRKQLWQPAHAHRARGEWSAEVDTEEGQERADEPVA